MGSASAALVLSLAALTWVASMTPAAAGRPAVIAVDYPASGSIFPPEIAAPTFLWRDPAKAASRWRIEVRFADGTPGLRAVSSGAPMEIGEIDPECVAATNEPPRLTPQQAAAHTWVPGAALWESIKQHSVAGPAEVIIRGVAGNPEQVVSMGRVTIQTSRDPVGAPIFYRDVPLMPTETEKGQIQPLAATALPLVNWRLRDISQTRSRVLMQDLPVCANCHSFSADGKTMGMDLDGLQNNKGLYTLTPVATETAIRDENVIEWRTAQGKLEGKIRIGFMSRVSPDGRYVVTTIDRSTGGAASPTEPLSNYYVANYKDYRFLQVFFPTRGVLAWYSRQTGVLTPLPGADDPRYVQMNAVWSPDGRYLVFARAAAKEPNPAGAPVARFANDPNENQIRYDLYRVAFNEGRGGSAEPVAGASHNGMSNTFPKISPDGRWIVYVRCRNGQLLRPDSQLYIVPAAGGEARRMRANLPLMNSWHSFSPNGRWLVFSSKSRSPYTQMYLTHIDDGGNDSPAILIENSTAANRAVNLPEFVNVPADRFTKLGGPVIEFYRLFNSALYLQKNGRHEESAERWKQVLALHPDEPMAHNNLGVVLIMLGRREEGAVHLRRANELRLRAVIATGGAKAGVYAGLGKLLLEGGRAQEAVAEFVKAAELEPHSASVQVQLAEALAASGRQAEAESRLREALAVQPRNGAAHAALGSLLSKRGRQADAIAEWRSALACDTGSFEAHRDLAEALYTHGEYREALAHWREAIRLRPGDPAAIRRAAWVLATCPDPAIRDGRKAVELAIRAVRLARNGQDPALLDVLAAAYAEAGRFPEAEQTALRGAIAATYAGKPPLARQFERRATLYRGGQPLRAAAGEAAP